MNKKLKIDNNTSLFSPSSWIENNLSKNSSKMNLLDLACGNGRHSVFAANAGWRTPAIIQAKRAEIGPRPFVHRGVEQPSSLRGKGGDRSGE